MDFKNPQSRDEAILQNILGAQNVLTPPQSRIEAILQAILYNESYTEPARSRVEELLLAIKNGGTWNKEAMSRSEKILKAKLNGEEYTDYPRSRIEELLIEWCNGTPAEVLKEVSGSIISITDALAKAAEELTVEIMPVQDLHGYDAPWLGGSGKNKLDTSRVENGTRDQNTGELISGSGNQQRTTYYIKVEAGQKIINTNSKSENNRAFFFNDDTYVSTHILANGVATTVPNGVNRMYVSSSASGWTGSTAPTWSQIEFGESATSYLPYSNVCPIAGFTGAMIYRTGKNVLKFPSTAYSSQRCTYTTTDNTVSVDANGTFGRASFAIPVKTGQTYTFSCIGNGTGDNNAVYLRGLDPWSATAASGNYGTLRVSTDTSVNITFTAISDVLYVGCYVTTSGTTGNMSLTDVQLELGSNATAYAPYNGDIYNVSWQSEAGTVYLGTIDISTGELISKYAMVDMGDLDWAFVQPSSSIRYGTFYAYIRPPAARLKALGESNLMCEIYKYSTSWSTDLSFKGNSANQIAYVVDSSFNGEVSDFKRGVSGHHFCYELASPITYQLTPTQIQMLEGVNNLWADCGSSTLKYWALEE